MGIGGAAWVYQPRIIGRLPLVHQPLLLPPKDDAGARALLDRGHTHALSLLLVDDCGGCGCSTCCCCGCGGSAGCWVVGWRCYVVNKCIFRVVDFFVVVAVGKIVDVIAVALDVVVILLGVYYGGDVAGRDVGRGVVDGPGGGVRWLILHHQRWIVVDRLGGPRLGAGLCRLVGRGGVAGVLRLVTGVLRLVIGVLMLVTGTLRLVTGLRRLVTGFLLLVAWF